MSETGKKYRGRPGLGYKLFKAYVGLFHNKFYYRNVYWLGTGNIPEDVPLMIVSDHQNGLNDALAVIFSVPNRRKRKIRFIARADVFLPAVKGALSWLGILPAYRNEYQGEGSAARNRFMLTEAAEELEAGGTVGIYPEAGHQDIRWLGKFSPGYLRIIFEAARVSGFRHEMFVIPSCNHYSDYFGFRAQILVKYGEPVSLAPYYGLYAESPRQALAEVNDTIRQRVSELMLDITDLDNYGAIDFLRGTYGIGYARRNGLDPRKLPDKLESDKRLFAELEAAKGRDESGVQAVYDEASELAAAIGEHRINDRDLGGKPSCVGTAAAGVGLLALLPLFAFACIPNYPVYLAPKIMTRKAKDVMLHSGINFAVSALITVPLLYILTFFLTRWLSGSWWIAAAHFASLPFLAVFAWKYSRWFVRWRERLRLRRLERRGAAERLREMRRRIYGTLDSMLG